jgi:hypothetical protein
MIPSAMNPFEDDEVRQSLNEVLSGGLDGFTDGAEPVEQPAPPQAMPMGPTAPAGPQQLPPQAAAPAPTPEEPTLQAPPRRKSAVGRVDPGLAFMAAFAQNPVLQKMVEESRNRPRAQQEFDAKNAAEGRASEKWKQERDIMAPLKATGLQQKNALGAAGLEGKQAGSGYSAAMRDTISQRLHAEATRMSAVNPFLASQMTKVAERIAGSQVSAEQAEAMLKPFAGLGDKIIGDARNEANDAEKHRSNVANEALGQGKLDLSYAQMKQRAANAANGAANKREMMILKPQEKLNKEINELDQALVNMGEMSELKKDVNTGVYVDALAKFTNKWIDSDLTSDKRKQLEALTARVFNKEVKTLAGSAVSASEWARIEPQIPSTGDDDSQFVSKLAKAIQITTEILQKRREEYQQKAGGGPQDQSTTAKKNVRAQTATGEKPMPAAPAAGAVQDAQEGARAYSAKAGKYFIRKGGKWVPE